MDALPSDAFDRLTRLASRILGAPTSLVSLVGPDRQFFVSAVGLSEPVASARQTPLSHSYCKYVVATAEPLVVRDAREHPVLRHSPAIRELDAIAYAGVPLRGTDGEVLGSFCAIDGVPRDWSDEDVAALRDLADLATTEMALRHQVEVTKRFVGTAAHDLRNPLGANITFSKILLKNEALGERERLLLTRIQESSRYMLRLVEDLVDVTVLEAGAMRLDLETVDLAEFVTVNTELHRALADEKDIAIEVAAPEGCVVRADRTKLRQVMANLLTNAVKFSHPGTTIHVSVNVDGDTAGLAVSDQGQGIPAAELDRLFRPFGRTSVLATAGEKSTGLGLMICRSIIEAHGGRIGVASEPGVGSTFRCELPCVGPGSHRG